jgi:endonuclease G, mitochondrial
VVVLEKGQSVGDVSETTRVIAVNMPNKKGIMSEGWGGYRTTVDALEKLTGYDFLPDVPERIQKAIEARVDTGSTSTH